MSKRPKQKALRDRTDVNSLSLPDHFRVHWLFTALHFLTPRLWSAGKREDQSRQTILLQAAAYLGTCKCSRLRKCLVAIMIQLSLVKSVKAPRSIYGKHNFIIVSVYHGKLGSDKCLICTRVRSFYLFLNALWLKQMELSKFLRYPKHYVSNFASGAFTADLFSCTIFLLSFCGGRGVQALSCPLHYSTLGQWKATSRIQAVKQGETQLSVTRSSLQNGAVKEGWSRISLTVQLQEQAGTAGRTEGSVSKRQDQGLEQIEADVGSQSRTTPKALRGNLAYGKTIS